MKRLLPLLALAAAFSSPTLAQDVFKPGLPVSDTNPYPVKTRCWTGTAWAACSSSGAPGGGGDASAANQTTGNGFLSDIRDRIGALSSPAAGSTNNLLSSINGWEAVAGNNSGDIRTATQATAAGIGTPADAIWGGTGNTTTIGALKYAGTTLASILSRVATAPAQVRYNLITNGTASGSVVPGAQGGGYIFSYAATNLNGATVTLYESNAAGVLTAVSGCALSASTANFCAVNVSQGDSVQAQVSGGTPTALYATLAGVGGPFSPFTPPTLQNVDTIVRSTAVNRSAVIGFTATSGTATTSSTTLTTATVGSTFTNQAGVTSGIPMSGQNISGTGIPAGTTIVSVSGTGPTYTLTLSAAATVSAGTALTSNGPQTVFPAEPNRRGLSAQNQHSSATCYMSTTPVIGPDSLKLQANTYYENPPIHVGTASIGVICDTSAVPFMARSF